MQWWNSLLSCGPKNGKAFVLSDHVQLRLRNECVRMERSVSRNVYKEIRTKHESAPTAQKYFTDQYSGICFDWHLRFSWIQNPWNFNVKFLNSCLMTFLYKIGFASIFTIMYILWTGERNPWTFYLLSVPTQLVSGWTSFVGVKIKVKIDSEILSNTNALLGILQFKEDFL